MKKKNCLWSKLTCFFFILKEKGMAEVGGDLVLKAVLCVQTAACYGTLCTFRVQAASTNHSYER